MRGRGQLTRSHVQLSEQHPTPFTPADYAFIVWDVIWITQAVAVAWLLYRPTNEAAVCATNTLARETRGSGAALQACAERHESMHARREVCAGDEGGHCAAPGAMVDQRLCL
jgi:hypothetical protein